MGLDQYLKTNAPQGNAQATGACGGLFPLAPAMAEEDREIGYWRKNYKLNEELLNRLNTDGGEDNCVDFFVDEQTCEDIIDFAKGEKEMLKEGDDCDNGWYDVSDWDYTIKTFKEALKLIKQGYTVKYFIWY